MCQLPALDFALSLLVLLISASMSATMTAPLGLSTLLKISGMTQTEALCPLDGL